MLHVVPIVCLIFFIFLVEYRLKQHIDRNDKELLRIKKTLKLIQNGKRM